MLLGIHDFINSQPILEPLTKQASKAGIEIRIDSPAQLADQLSAGKLDIAMQLILTPMILQLTERSRHA